MTTSLRPGLPPLPERMRRLPVDERGYPIPEFVSRLDGKRDFRVVSLDHLAKCIREDVCWVCGELLGELKVFVTGPISAIRGINNEPPSHAECAEFAARACPFLLLPKAQHRTVDDERVRKMPGATRMNPGICCLYTVRGYACHERPKGVIFRMGRALRVEWYAQGRRAELAEVQAAMEATLQTMARNEAIEKRVAELLTT